MTLLSTQQRRALQKQVKDCPPSEADVRMFLDDFYFLEALIRTIGRYYRNRSGTKPKMEKHESLNRDVVARSFQHFGIFVSGDLLDLLLSSDRKKRNEKSARNLRNGIAHNWNKEDRKRSTNPNTSLT